jgi:hypothetical protein
VEGSFLSRSTIWSVACRCAVLSTAASSLALSLGLGACRGKPGAASAADVAPAASVAPADKSTRPQRLTAEESHQKMLAALDDVRQRTYRENFWQGEGVADVARQKLAALGPDADPVERWKALLDVAHHELRLGNEEESIAKYEEAYALLPRLAGKISDDARARGIFRLGVAWLRHGETLNCANRHNAESCILPIRGAGIHTEPKGSQRAMEYFVEVLGSTPRTSLVNAKALWLLNIAAMTIGLYPHGVPEPYRIPYQIFSSEVDFPRFENIAAEAGVGSWSLFGGVVTDDFDGDGWVDALVTTSDVDEQTRFFHNDGDGTFSERTREAGLEGLTGGLNVVQADYDNDGDLDVFIMRGAWLSAGGKWPSSLVRNEGGGRFIDVTFAAGIDKLFYPTQTAAWADYDNDGDVDLYVGIEHGDQLFDGPCQLWRNRGDGTFEEVAAAAGVDERGYVKGVIWGDYDQDRFPDLYVSVLDGPNLLYRNQGDGTFVEVAESLGVSAPVDSFPVWFWDFNNDGALDLYSPSYKSTVDAVGVVAASYFGATIPWELPALYAGDGRGGFRDVAPEVGLTKYLLPMGANFADVDDDGWLDFYLGTGYPDYEGLTPNVLYHNVSGKRFVDVTFAAGVGHIQKGHAIAFFDLEHDGDLDIFAQMGGAFPGDAFADALFRNPGFGNHWIELALEGRRTNRAAIGARLRVDVIENGKARSIYRSVNSGGSFGANPLRQHIGIGSSAEVDTIEVYWPTSDTTQTFRDVAVDRRYRVIEGESSMRPLEVRAPGSA